MIGSRPLALTMGEPAGIGGELAIKAWLARAEGVPPFVALDDPARLRAVAERIGADAPVAEIDDPAEVPQRFADALPVLPMALSAPAEPGRPCAATAPDVIASIERAVALAQAGDVAGVVTNPIQKKPLMEAGFAHPGHTEFLGALAGPGHEPVMMLVVPGLRVVPVTGHIALSAVAGALDADTIVRSAAIRLAALALPVPAMSSAVPWSGEVRTKGRLSVTFTPRSKSMVLSGISAWS
jgi:4-hydroxythreonine-4-phosphate dehydrogenase